MSAVLVLDIGMQPLRVQSWQDAITDVFLGKAEVVHYSADKTIRSVHREWPMPSVVRLLRNFKRDRVKTKFSRINVYARDNFTCQYCGKQKLTNNFSYDHVIPRAQGGRTTWENIVTCCSGPDGCNIKKGNRTPEQAGMKLLSIPKKPRFLPNIQVPIERNAPPEWRHYWKAPLIEE
jgi:5-methylcytosine-specific restriction endonuclease McrA